MSHKRGQRVGRLFMIAAGGLLCLGAAGLERREAAVMLRGEPMTLLGPELQVGEQAPAFILTDNSLEMATLDDFSGKIKVISTVPSLDTGVCSLETRRFNELASEMGDDVVVLTISMDLPFAQKRWCGANEVDRVVTLSDYKDHAFGEQYGVLMEKSKLLARTVFLVDKKDTIRDIQRVPEISHEPDYEAVLAALRQLKQESAP